MKITIHFSILISAMILWSGTQGIAQNTDCVQCNGCTVTGTNASAIGKGNTASGNNSFAGGYNSVASGSNSFAFGYSSSATQSTNVAIGNAAQATGIGATAIGTNVKASAQNSYVIGSGTTTSNPLNNSTPNSIALGVNSNKPTLMITKALNNNYTGKVAIGPVTNPQSKLHIKSDSNEDAGILIEPTNKSTKKAFINLFDSNHTIAVEPGGTMTMNSGSNTISFVGNDYSFGEPNEQKIRFYTKEVKGVYFNARHDRKADYRDGDGTSYAFLFNNDDLCFRTALCQEPRGTAITNWKDALLLCSDGKIGLGSKTTYLENNDDKSLTLQSPNRLNINSNTITLNGKVGINTTSEVADYALAVNGGIISTKVFIKEAQNWPDYVFAKDYPLMELEELEDFLNEHHHLPEVPTEAEVVREGYDLHEMQCVLLKKIEEMTRYIILLKQEIDHLRDTTKSMEQVHFVYDECGNRILREIVIEQLPRAGEKPIPPDHLSYKVFPNPTSGGFFVFMKDGVRDGEQKATLLSSTGILLEERMIQGTLTQFDLSDHANGMYLLVIDTPEGSQTWKIIKQ